MPLISMSLLLFSPPRLELFDGNGGLVTATVVQVGKSSCQLAALHSPQRLKPAGPQWTVVAACGSLKGGRADWLVEKCTVGKGSRVGDSVGHCTCPPKTAQNVRRCGGALKRGKKKNKKKNWKKRKGLDWARAQNVCFRHLSIALHSMLILEEHPWEMGDGGLCGIGLNWFG